MNLPARTARRLGVIGSLLVALLGATARLAAGQATTPPQPLSLGGAARLAARQSALAEGARFRAVEAEARVRQRQAERWPDVSGIASQNGRSFNTATLGLDLPTGTNPTTGQPNPPLFNPAGQVIGPVNTSDIRARVNLPVYDPAVNRRISAARASASAADLDAANLAEQAAMQATSAYLRALRADGILRARVADSSLAADLVSIAQSQLQAGVGVGLDVTRAQSQLAAIRAQLLAARNDRDRSFLDLQRALGVSLEVDVTLTDSLGALTLGDTVPSEAAALERAMRTRPDLRSADEQLRAAQQQLAALRAERLPAIGLYADDGGSGKNWAHLLNTYTYGLQLTVPLFDGNRRESREQEQQAVAREIDVRRRDLRQAAAIEVRGALLDLASAREQVAASQERLRLAEQELQQARDRFRAGVAGNADVITASLSLNGARNLVVEALTAFQSARVSLARAQGSVTELP